MFWIIVSFVVGFVVGALVFRNNPVRGEELARSLESMSIAQKIVAWFKGFTSRKEG
jgi:hypothetical protein